MTLQELTAILTPCALALRADIDVPTYRAYHRMLEKVPVRLLLAALEKWGEEGLRFFPTAPELRAKSEEARQALLAEHPYRACDACNRVGHVSLPPKDGKPQYDRCRCWYDHQARLAELGIATPVLRELPSGQFEKFDPRLAQVGSDE